jgi:hypothetical protein
MDAVFDRLASPWLRVPLMLLLLVPGLAASWKLHPYEYTYYNSLVGGTGHAAARFETDYWLTCYKDAIAKLNELGYTNPRVYVRREPQLAAYYANPQVTVIDGSQPSAHIERGDYFLYGSRADPRIQNYLENINLFAVRRAGAVFCIVDVYTR